eukprot:10683128-Karenia_brevis.AAC.1
MPGVGAFLVSVTPEGFVTHVKELYPELGVLFYDDSCHLRCFAAKFASLSSLAQQIAYPSLKFVLDRFHATNHVDEWCIENVYPETDENSPLLEGINTSRNEILFQWMAKYKHMFRKMGQWTGNFFAQEVMDLPNEKAFPADGEDQSRRQG